MDRGDDVTPSPPLPKGFRSPTIGARSAAALRELLDLAEVVGDEAIPCRAAEDRSLWISEDPDEAARAAALCADCPLLPDCRSYGRAARELGAVYGGLTPQTRLELFESDPRRKSRPNERK